MLDVIHMPKIGHFSLGCQVVAKHVKCNFYGFEWDVIVMKIKGYIGVAGLIHVILAHC